jgi:isocitrate dehydrogenase
MSKTIAVAYGDGIGPEIMEATLKILKESKANINIETIQIGKKLYEQGYSSGIPEEAWKIIRRNKIILKSPITTPQGGGYKSLNVTLRKSLGLFANIRPCKSFHPYVKTNHPLMDLIIVRENEEDLYAGIEYRQTHNSYQTLKLVSETGTERIVRYAFEYAVKNNRKKVTCLSKDNIMKFTDGIFHRIFDTIAKEYPNITSDHYIVDIGTARLANKPEIFDVIVTSNLYGDIISDVAAEVSGSVGLAGSANIGNEYAMFEAIHGSAPDIAGQNIANPSGLLHSAVMMLVHIGESKAAEAIHNSLLKTLEEGFHTKDIYNPAISKKLCSTTEFTDKIIEYLGQAPSKMEKISYNTSSSTQKDQQFVYKINKKPLKKLLGVDVYLDWLGEASQLANKMQFNDTKLKLQMISLKGLTVWPNNEVSVSEDDNWRLRFTASSTQETVNHNDIIDLLMKINKTGIDCIKTENLYSFDDKIGFSLAQGE